MRLLVFLALFFAACLAEAREAVFPLQWEYATGSDLPLSLAKDSTRPYLYAAIKSGGLLVLDISRQGSPLKAASLPPARFNGLDVTAVTQQGDYLFLALGDFFDAKGQKAGIAIVDIRDPKKPAVTSVRVTDKKLHGAAAILVKGDDAYLAAMEYGVFVFNVADKNNIEPVSTIMPDRDFPRKNPGAVQRPNARGLALRGDTLFVAYDAGGLRAVDVADNRHPREISRYINASMLRKQQAYNNLVVRGDYAYIAVDYCGLEIVDIAQIGNMKGAGWYNPWRCQAPLSLWFNSAGHTNQIALDPARPVAYLSGGDRELLAVDVSSPEKPVLAAAYGGTKDGAGTWGMTLGDSEIYLAYIKTFIPFHGTWSGIRAVER